MHLPDPKRPNYRVDPILQDVKNYATGKHPDNAWYQWPDHNLTPRSRNTYANRIRRGHYGEEFEACVRNGHLYARYVPHNNTKEN